MTLSFAARKRDAEVNGTQQTEKGKTMDEYYRLSFSNLHTETFDDYRDVENAMAFFQSRGIEFQVQRTTDASEGEWVRIPRPFEYRAPGREYSDTPGEYDCPHCGLRGGH